MPECHGSWAPQDVHAYLRADTDNYRRAPGWGKYNECNARRVSLEARTTTPCMQRCLLNVFCVLSWSAAVRAPGWTVLVDGYVWEANLPYSIEAFMSSRDGDVAAVHREFLAAFPQVTEADVPLITMTPSIERPFVLGPGYGSQGDPTRFGDRPPGQGRNAPRDRHRGRGVGVRRGTRLP